MGCDIHIHGEKRDGDRWVHVKLPDIKHGRWEDKAFGARQYGKFGFMADVRNYSAVEPICPPNGLPDDASPETKAEYEDWSGDAHTPSWLTIAQMEAFDYERTTEDRRYTRKEANGVFNGGATCEPGKGESTTVRKFLESSDYFESLAAVKEAGIERIVFWFDN